MSILKKVGAALVVLAVVEGVSAAPAELTGYFRSGAGSSDKGGKEVCFRLPGSVVWFRLGNECDTYAAVSLGANLGEVDGTAFKVKFTTAYGTQQLANWEQTTPALREAYVQADNIGASLGVPVLNGASLWAGKRFYKNPDIHMLDYTYWEAGMGPGFGVDGVDLGQLGKFSYALFRIGDFTGYGANNSLSVGGYNPEIIDGGSRTATVHDLRLQEIPVNPGGKLTMGVDLVSRNNRDGTSTYTTDTVQPVIVNGTTYNLIVRETKTVDNGNAKNGFGFTLTHQQKSPVGLDGFNEVGFQYAHDAAALKGFGFAGSADKRREWLVFDHWSLEPKGSPFSMTATAGLRDSTINDKGLKDVWIGARPQYQFNRVWSLMSEVGYQQLKPEGGDTRKLTKLTVGTQYAMGGSVWSRPSIRFYATHAKWNDAAAAAGSVVCTGRDCNTAVNAYSDKRSGTGYGVQVETWF